MDACWLDVGGPLCHILHGIVTSVGCVYLDKSFVYLRALSTEGLCRNVLPGNINDYNFSCSSISSLPPVRGTL